MSRIPIRDVVNSLRRFLHRQNCLPDIHPTRSPFAQHVLRCDLVEVSTSAKWYEAKGVQAGKWTFLWPTLVIPWFHSLSNNLPHLYLERSTKQSWCQLNFFNGKSQRNSGTGWFYKQNEGTRKVGVRILCLALTVEVSKGIHKRIYRVSAISPEYSPTRRP